MTDTPHAAAPAAPRIAGAAARAYFHGNCQLPLLAKLIGEVRPGWRIAARQVHARDTLAEEAETRRDVAEADIIVAQPISENYRGVDWLSLGAVRAMARPGAVVVTIPSLYFDGQLPGWGYIGAGANRLRTPRMHYSCYLVAAMVLAGLKPGVIAARLTAPGFLAEGFLRAHFEAALAELARREKAGAVDVVASDLYAERGRQRPVAHTVNHPLRHIAAAIAGRVLHRLGEAATVPEDGTDHLPLPHIPLLPATEAALGIPADAERQFHLGGTPRPARNYLARLAARYADLPEGSLRQQVHGSREAMRFLAALAAAHPKAAWARPGEPSAEAA